MLFSCSWLFELLSLNICSLIHVSLQFFEVYRVSNICNFLKIFLSLWCLCVCVCVCVCVVFILVRNTEICQSNFNINFMLLICAYFGIIIKNIN